MNDNVTYGAGFKDLYEATSNNQAMLHTMNERFCLNTKCSWNGPSYRTDNGKCPLCGNDTERYQSNDGFTFSGPQQNKTWNNNREPIIVDPNESTFKAEFIRPYNERYHLGDLSGSLPPYFHYDGMNKIKAGKGYRNGKPYGVIGEQCDECDGNIISIKICTSSKGFTTTSEKVCDKCGLVYPGSFQILDKPEDNYKSPSSETHAEWKEQNIPDMDFDDTDMYIENVYHLYGGTSKGINLESMFYNRNTPMPPRLKKAIERLAKTPESMRIPRTERRTKQYHDIADDYIHELGLNKADARDVYYYIEHRGHEFDTRYQMEDVILCICFYVMSRRWSKQKIGRQIQLFGSRNKNIKKLYSLVKQKLS